LSPFSTYLTGFQVMMTARPLAQPSLGGTSWPWLTCAAEMAALTCPGLLWPGLRRPSVQPRFPRVATRSAGDLAAVSAARDFARSTLHRWGLAARGDDVTVVLSELLSNGLRHARPQPGGWPVRLGLLEIWPGAAVLCAVADPSPAPPVLGQAGYLDESGRGLHVVDELSDRWGYTTTGHRGKVVWAAFGSSRD
jgi:anti-sigma regulatory factor (Ser/Thr protein kinase)